MGIAVWRVRIKQKISHFWGMSVFAQKKMCAFQRSSEHVVIRRVARLSRIGAGLMFGPPGHTTASPRALRGPVGTQRAPVMTGQTTWQDNFYEDLGETAQNPVEIDLRLLVLAPHASRHTI